MISLIWLGLYAASAFGQATCTSADVSNTLPPPTRNQWDVGACHAFASVAEIESALYRLYGVKIKLSEADLEVENTIATPQYWKSEAYELDKDAANHQATAFTNDDLLNGEGNFPYEDIKYAKSHGIALEAEVPYINFRYNYGPTARIDKTNFPDQQSFRTGLAQFLTNFDRMAQTNFSLLSREPTQIGAPPQGQVFMQEAATPEYLSSIKDRLLNANKIYPNGHSKKYYLEYEKHIIQVALKPMRIKHQVNNNYRAYARAYMPSEEERNYNNAYQSAPAPDWLRQIPTPQRGDLLTPDSKSCEKNIPKTLEKAIINSLCSGQPVVIGVNLDGLTNPRFVNEQGTSLSPQAPSQSAASHDAWHSVVITSFSTLPNGRKKFWVRNSWGPDANFSLSEADLCQIFDATELTIPVGVQATPEFMEKLQEFAQDSPWSLALDTQ